MKRKAGALAVLAALGIIGYGVWTVFLRDRIAFDYDARAKDALAEVGRIDEEERARPLPHEERKRLVENLRRQVAEVAPRAGARRSGATLERIVRELEESLVKDMSRDRVVTRLKEVARLAEEARNLLAAGD
jgi:hypothetical protein